MQAGPGTLVITSSNNTYTGGTTVSGGTLLINPGGALNSTTSWVGSGTVTINAGATLDAYTNSFGYTAASLPSVVINGALLNSISGADGPDSHIGAVTMTAGTLSGSQFDPHFGITTLGSTAEALISVATLRLEANNTFNVSAGTTGGADLVVTSAITQDGGPYGITKAGAGLMQVTGSSNYGGGTTVNGGILQLGSNLALGSGTGALTVGSSGTLDLNGFSPTVGAVNGAGTINNVSARGSLALTVGSGGVAGTFSGTIQNTSGTLSLVKIGAGTESLSGTNTYTGGTQLNGGILNFAASAVPHAVPRSITFGGGTLQYAAGNTVDVSGAIAPIASGQAAIIDTGSNSVTFASPLSGGGGLTKAGAGVLTLLGANAYSGSTTISAGTLQVGSGGNLGSLPNVSPITDNVTLAFSRSDTVTQGTNFNSTITGSGGLVQAGPGTLVLNGANSYTGATAVNAGLLEIATSGSLYGGNSASWASNISVASGGTLAVTIGGPSDFSANGGAQAVVLLASAFQVGSYFGFDTTNSVTSVLAQGVTASSSLFQDGAYLSAPITVQNTFGISKLGTGTLVLLASNGNTYTGGTSVANGELVMQGTGGAGAVSVTNSIPQGTTVLSVQNSEALGDRTLTKQLNPISLNATGGSLSASILEIGAKQGTNTVTGNTWDFAYGVVAAGSTPGNGQISLSPSASGGNNSGVGFAAFNAGSLSTPRIVGLLAVVNGTTVTTATLQTLQEGTYFAAGNHLTLGSPTANNTLDLLNPVDLNAASGASGAAVRLDPRGEHCAGGRVCGRDHQFQHGGAGGIPVNFSGNGGLIFASPTSSYVAQTLQVNGGAVFVGTGDPAAAGQTGPFGSGAAALQIGTSATSGGANLGFMTYGANAGVGPAPTIITNRSLVVGGNGAPSTGVVLGGFTDDYTAINGGITLNGSATFTANGPAAGGRVDFNGTISGSGAVVVGNGSSTYVEGDSNANGIKGIQLLNNGAVVFAGANGYTGPTTIDNGELYVNGSLNAASAVTVLSGATLGGKGTVSGAVTVQAGGMLEGGQMGAGTLTLGGGLTFSGIGSAIDFGGLAASGGPGLKISGSLSISNPVTINVTGAIPGTGNYPLISSSSPSLLASNFVVGRFRPAPQPRGRSAAASCSWT